MIMNNKSVKKSNMSCNILRGHYLPVISALIFLSAFSGYAQKKAAAADSSDPERKHMIMSRRNEYEARLQKIDEIVREGVQREMKKDFEAVSVSADGLSGEMRPRQGVPAANFIRSIRFFFEDDSLAALRRVVIDECSGDETDIEFLSSVRNQPVPEEKWRPDGN